MAYFLFIDESGHDRSASPYEVLAGVAVKDQDLWNLILAIQDAEIHHFGRRYSQGTRELKGKKLLKRKTYRLAGQLPPFPPDERRELARRCLDDVAHAGKREITALAQAKIAYVQDLLNICSRFRCIAIASIINPDSPAPSGNDFLRKDYAYLFERFFYLLEELTPSEMGIVVFDELEKSRSHVLVGQMDWYFKETGRGRLRSGRIIPEPFFVHSDLTTGIQIADLFAYLISWGVRVKGMSRPAREELASLAETVCTMRIRFVRDIGGNPEFGVWSFAVINDLRGRDDRT